MATRGDGRLSNELRPLVANSGALNRCDGATRFRLGRTEVVVSVRGPYEPKRSRQCPDRAILDVVLLPRTGRLGALEREFEHLILRALHRLIVARHQPLTFVQVVIQVVLDDGALLSAALNAACLALAHAGVPLCGLIGAVTLALPPMGQVILDPTADEQRSAASVTTLCYLLQYGGQQAEGPGQLLVAHVQGILERSQYEVLAASAQEAGVAVVSLQRLALQRSTQ